MVINVVLGSVQSHSRSAAGRQPRAAPPVAGRNASKIYDMIGTFGLLLLVFMGGRFLSQLINPCFRTFQQIFF